MRSPRAFTLIELLVVITVIVVLLALLAPALEKAIDAAERARCAANLDAWGIAVFNYTVENKNKLLTSFRRIGASTHPSWVWGRVDKAQQYPDQWSAPAMQKYVQGVDLVNHIYGRLWYCPSNGSPNRDGYNKQLVEQTSIDDPTGWNQYGFFISDYGYFARADVWGKRQATLPDALTGRHLAAGKLLMADSIFRISQSRAYAWNHGQEGYSRWTPEFGGPMRTDPSLITGANQLFGDGSVNWKNDFRPKEMDESSTLIGWVSSNGATQAPDPTGHLHFY